MPTRYVLCVLDTLDKDASPSGPTRDTWDHRCDESRSLGPGPKRSTPHPVWENGRSHPFVSPVDRSTECPVPVHALWSQVKDRRHHNGGVSPGSDTAPG